MHTGIFVSTQRPGRGGKILAVGGARMQRRKSGVGVEGRCVEKGKGGGGGGGKKNRSRRATVQAPAETARGGGEKGGERPW